MLSISLMELIDLLMSLLLVLLLMKFRTSRKIGYKPNLYRTV
jgi:hypothetical protein